jgi:saccharopine dehydrogenase (NAD+, L-lysine-forming)
LENLDKLDNHVHMYFSHSYKNQEGSEQLLKMFKISDSIIYDFEYFIDNNGNRIIGFSLFAGYVGGILGIKQFYGNLNIKPWNSFNNMVNECSKIYNKNNIPKIGIIGYKGKCGQGVCDILDNFGILYIKIDKLNSNMIEKMDIDILYNCICLKDDYNEIWFDENTKYHKRLIIIDISCDASKVNNPIKIYNQCTTNENPVYKYNNFEIIAISNLPSLLPYDSSDYFSDKLIKLISDMHTYSWNKNYETFYKKMININY